MKVKEQISDDVLNEISIIEDTRDRLQKICEILSVEFPSAEFKVHHADDHIIYSFVNCQPKRIQYFKDSGTFCFSKNKSFDGCLFFGFFELVRFLNIELFEMKTSMNLMCEQFFRSCAKSFNFSNDVASPKTTLFSNLITLKHKDNSFIKGLFGKNKYFKILLTVVKTSDDNVNFCVGSFDSCKDEVMVSSRYKEDLLRLLDYALRVKYGFEINVPTFPSMTDRFLK